ncbi:MAG: carboxypeptidase regulatory-like domain-containing protein, partial [Microthrixaceae bacterium]
MGERVVRAVARLGGAATAVMLLGFFLLWAAGPAGAAGTGSVSGIVTAAESGAPLAGICVTARVSVLSQDQGRACTDPSGRFTISGLAPNNYTLVVQDPVSGYVTTTLTEVRVATGQAVTGADARMARGAAVVGTVRDAATGSPLAGVCVTAASRTGAAVGEGCTDATGTYRTEGLPSGSYSVAFRDTVGNRVRLELPDPVAVAAGRDTLGVDAVLRSGASASGTVRDAGTGLPVAGVCVSPATSDAGSFAFGSFSVPVGGRCTDASGAFSTEWLPAGSYRLTVEDPLGRYLTGFRDVALGEGAALVGQDVNVELGGSIGGRVTEESTGTPLAGVCVTVTGPGSAAACTDADGNYRIGGLPDGAYLVAFEDELSQRFLTEYHSGREQAVGADLVVVTARSNVVGIDASLRAGGRIAGVVRDSATGSPVAGACVQPLNTNTASGNFSSYSYSCSDSNGRFVAWGLPVGDYLLSITAPAGSDYLPQIFDGLDPSSAASYTTAPTFRVGAPGESVDGVAVRLAKGGSVSGTVRDAAGNPVPAACASVFRDAFSLSFFNTTRSCTGADGRYRVGGLRPGSYKVRVDGPLGGPLLARYFPGAATESAATVVEVVGAADRGATDVVLPVGGAVRGRVVVAGTGTPVPGACVFLQGAASSSSFGTTAGRGSACTGADGTYVVQGLSGGDYTASVSPPVGANLLPTFYRSSPDQPAATPFSVTEGATTSSIDAALAVGGSISGRVTDPSGTPVAGACVTASGSSASSLSFGTSGTGATGCTGPDGTYRLTALSTGSFSVRFAPPLGANLLPQWFRGSTTIEGATPVAVTAGSDTPAIDAALGRGSTISGRVTDGSGAAVAGACVAVVDPGAFSFGFANGGSGSVAPNGVVPACSGIDGRYILTGLPAGTYTVQFLAPPGSPFVGQFYDGSATAAGASSVPVGAVADVVGIDAVLRRGAVVRGTVTDRATGQPLPGVLVQLTTAGAPSGAPASGITDATGQYQIGGLLAGSYKVRFSKSLVGIFGSVQEYLVSYWRDAPDLATADTLTVASEATVDRIDASLVRAGEVTGRITDEAGLPLPGACAVVRPASNLLGSGPTGCTGADGTYRVQGLALGNYVVEFVGPTLPGGGRDRVSQWFNDKPTGSTADVVSVRPALVASGIDARLRRGAVIEGTVTDEAGVPLAGACVNASAAAGVSSQQQSACTDSAGRYRLGALPAGSYTLFAAPPFGSNLVGVWFDGRTDGSPPDQVEAAVGRPVTANFALPVGGSIAGRVISASSGQPMQTCLGAYRVRPGTSSTFVASTCTSADGNYRIPGLVAGSYKLYLFGGNNVNPQWFDGAADEASATPVALSAGQAVTGKDFRVDPPGDLGTITGRVTDAATGQPLTSACVDAISVPETFVRRTACTDATGAYSLKVPAGTWKVFFDEPASSPSLAFEYWNDRSTQSTADAVVVTAGGTTPNIDGALGAGATLTGRVTDASNGAPLSSVCISLYDLDGNLVRNRFTCSQGGAYVLSGLAPGAYRVQFSNFGGRYIEQWFSGRPDRVSSDPVNISVAGPSTADAAMVLGGSISGRVTAKVGGAPLAGVCVQLVKATGGFGGFGGCTGPDGRYQSNGLPPGQYKVRFEPSSSEFLGTWFDGKGDEASATPVNVIVGVDSSNVDAALEAVAPPTTTTTTTTTVPTTTTTTVPTTTTTTVPTTTTTVPTTTTTTTTVPTTTTTTVVVNQSPSAVISPPSSDGLTVDFSGLGSTDPDGSIVGYLWDFGDGGSSSEPAPRHTYAQSGIYTVTLRVSDNDGLVGETSISVTVTATTTTTTVPTTTTTTVPTTTT